VSEAESEAEPRLTSNTRIGRTPAGRERRDVGDIHLDKRGITLRDPDGLRVLIQSPTETSPDWLKQMVK
jgi:hypothetical protein